MRRSALLVSLALVAGLAGAVLAQQMQGMDHGHMAEHLHSGMMLSFTVE